MPAPRISLTQARERAAKHGWTVMWVNRAVLGCVYLLIPPTGRTIILYDLGGIDSCLPQ